MVKVPIQDFITTAHNCQHRGSVSFWRRLQAPIFRNGVLLVLTILLLLGSLLVDSYRQPGVYAASPGPGKACNWYTVQAGDTLSRVATRTRSSIWTLAQANYIRNINLIFVGQRLCIPYTLQQGPVQTAYRPGGILADGNVRWYAYDALEWSTRSQVSILLRQAAAYYGLPVNLVLAVAWQESGWNHHVIARDGGIGVMQIMPYTAKSINIATGFRRDPYKLRDNIYLGANYLRMLCYTFPGDMTRVISAYNQGPGAVVQKGIFNWSYVNNVRYLMSVLR
jgi:soluble lytic murein transglycosylase-like protein